jgi:DNA polymerase III epsilon subunit-like protein
MINPGIPIPRAVSALTGITDADVVGAQPFEDVGREIRALFKNAITVAHNYTFDLGFLRAESLRMGIRWPEPLAEIDTVDLSMRCFPGERSHKLNAVCKRLDVALEQHHRATDDAAACGMVFTELARRRDVEDDLQAMLEWAGAIGQPPANGPIGPDHEGRIVFKQGPYAGDPVGDHPIHLAWMDKARVRQNGAWQFRFAESTRAWVRRWLEVRGAGRARMNPKSFHSDDWLIDSCIASERRTHE